MATLIHVGLAGHGLRFPFSWPSPSALFVAVLAFDLRRAAVDVRAVASDHPDKEPELSRSTIRSS